MELFFNNIAAFFTDIWNSFHKVFIEKDRYISYFNGIQNTLLIAFFSVIFGVLLGTIVAAVKYKAKESKAFKPLAWIANIYIYIIRGTPVYLQLFIIYFMVFNTRDSNPIVAGISCFAINSGAYVAEIMRAGIESIDKGQMEAARSLGVSHNKSMLYIILPQAIKNILPALGNEFIVLVKETAIVGAISVVDVTKAAEYIGASTYEFVMALVVSAMFYLVIVYVLSALLKSFERRLGKSDRS